MGLKDRTYKFLQKMTMVVRVLSKSYPGTAKYWNTRYKKGLTSGTGSYGLLACFKADVINKFVRENKIQQVAEFGCGDGNQIGYLDIPRYLGLDIAPSAISICRNRFKDDPSKSFQVYHPYEHTIEDKYELTLSLDVLFHIIEEHLYQQYLTHLFETSNKYVIIYARNFDGPLDYSEKNRAFLPWIRINFPHFKLTQVLKNKYPFDPNKPNTTSMSDFYFFEKMP